MAINCGDGKHSESEKGEGERESCIKHQEPMPHKREVQERIYEEQT